MTYCEDMTREEKLALAIKQVDYQAEMLHDLSKKAKARYDERKAKYGVALITEYYQLGLAADIIPDVMEGK